MTSSSLFLESSVKLGALLIFLHKNVSNSHPMESGVVHMELTMGGDSRCQSMSACASYKYYCMQITERVVCKYKFERKFSSVLDPSTPRAET